MISFNVCQHEGKSPVACIFHQDISNLITVIDGIVATGNTQ